MLQPLHDERVDKKAAEVGPRHFMSCQSGDMAPVAMSWPIEGSSRPRVPVEGVEPSSLLLKTLMLIERSRRWWKKPLLIMWKQSLYQLSYTDTQDMHGNYMPYADLEVCVSKRGK